MTTAIGWTRRHLCLHDNQALDAALSADRAAREQAP